MALEDLIYKDGFYWTRAGEGPCSWDGSTARIIGDSAPVHGDIRALLMKAQGSVHAASGVVSTGPGRLYGIIMVTPGVTSPTIKIYDNASAASGTVLREAAAAEIVKGGFLYCGPKGEEVLNGLYIELGGATAPIVHVIFEGTYPTVAHAGTVRYFDGTSGNDAWDGTAPAYTTGTTGPKRTMSGSDYDTGNWQLFFKRGTTVEYSRASSILWQGTDMLLADYGDASQPRPIIRIMAASNADTDNQFASQATTGVIEYRNLHVQYFGTDGKRVGALFSAVRGIRMIATNCLAKNTVNSFAFGGDYSRIVDCTSEDCSQGVLWGNTGFAPPNYSLVLRHTVINASADVWSVHDGTGTGAGQVILAGTGSNVGESFLDVQDMYTSGYCGYCESSRSGTATTYNIGIDNATYGNWTIIGNVLLDSTARGAALVKGPGTQLIANYIESAATSGVNYGFEPTATNCLVLNNTTYVRGTSNRAHWNMGSTGVTGSSGTFVNNITINDTNSNQFVLQFVDAANSTAWVRNGNCWWATGASYRYNHGAVVQTSTAAYLTAAQASAQELQSLNQNPGLIATYRLPVGSVLRSNGVKQTACYLTRFGPLWAFTPPPMGMWQP